MRFAVDIEKVGYCPDAIVIVADAILLVRRMKSIVGKAKAHEHRRDAQVLGKLADDWYRTAAANKYCRLAEHLSESLRRNVNGGVIRIYRDGRTSAQHPNVGADAAWRIALNPLSDGFEYALRLLIRARAAYSLWRLPWPE